MLSDGNDTSSDRRPRPVWRNHDFVLLLSGQTVSRLGSRVSDLALPLLVLALTNAPLQAGLIAATQSLPYLFLSLPAGAVLDRANRKRIMILCDAARSLAMVSIPVSYATGHLGLLQLYVVALVVGLALVFFDGAEGAALPNVVPATQLTRAVGLTSTAEAATYLLGPGLAGALISLARTTIAGAALAYLVDGCSYLVSLLTLCAIRLPFQTERAARTALSSRALRQEIMGGGLLLGLLGPRAVLWIIAGGLGLCALGAGCTDLRRA